MILTKPQQIIIPRNKGRQPVQDYNQINLEDSDDIKTAKMEYWISKAVGAKLEQKYSGREWGVRVNIPGSMVEIFCFALSGTHAYHLKLNCTLKELQRKALKAAGEILERFNVTRNKKYDTDITEAFDRDIKGDVIGGDNG